GPPPRGGPAAPRRQSRRTADRLSAAPATRTSARPEAWPARRANRCPPVRFRRACARTTARGPGHRRSARARQPAAPARAVPDRAFPACRSRAGSSQPALAAAIMLDGAEAFSPRGGQPEVELLDVLVLRELARCAIHHHAPGLEDVPVVGKAQRDI